MPENEVPPAVELSPEAEHPPTTVRIPKVWFVLGDHVNTRGYPICYCEKGDNSGSVIVGYVVANYYSLVADAMNAYNDKRNSDENV